MGKKHYPQSIKDEAVLFYELGHSFAETQAKYGMAALEREYYNILGDKAEAFYTKLLKKYSFPEIDGGCRGFS